MTRVLIPFSEPKSAARAVAMLIGEAPDRQTSVHLLAAVEPRVSGKVILHVSPAHAEALVLAAAKRWLVLLEAMLAAAGIPCTSEIVVGPTKDTIRDAAARVGVDRVLLPAAKHRWLSQRERARIEQRGRHPVTLVA
ncbi:MAG: universal stress protein [Steroidobacterales bacterium]